MSSGVSELHPRYTSLEYREHHWITNACPSCHGCVYKDCTAHAVCDCTGGLDG